MTQANTRSLSHRAARPPGVTPYSMWHQIQGQSERWQSRTYPARALIFASPPHWYKCKCDEVISWVSCMLPFWLLYFFSWHETGQGRTGKMSTVYGTNRTLYTLYVRRFFCRNVLNANTHCRQTMMFSKLYEILGIRPSDAISLSLTSFHFLLGYYRLVWIKIWRKWVQMGHWMN